MGCSGSAHDAPGPARRSFPTPLRARSRCASASTQAARPIHVARHGAQAADGPVRGRHVRAHLVDAAARKRAPPRGPRRTGARHARHPPPPRRTPPPRASGVKGRTCSANSPKPWHHASTNAWSTRPSPYDDMNQPQRQRAVGARPRRQPQVRQGCHLRAARVDDHECGVGACENCDDGAPERRIVGLRRVRAPDEQAVGEARHDVGLHGPAERDARPSRCAGSSRSARCPCCWATRTGS